ncbi:hypothetical protein [Paenibacillus sp. OV219]|uniref:hypothetical protein n=1 Tax=Paenibacillus sp. OV219 TaxID=1884377 RepID=UPI0008BCD6E7|nr:hypothetical protein [Paenibacillus sp. OV219]SEN35762.1 hypothetical protein SAMN05518847_102756 [Paenibacillus sp. OV219]
MRMRTGRIRAVQLTLLAVMLLLLSSCGEKGNTEIKEAAPEKMEHVEMQDEMPSEFDFSVSFGYGEINKNEVNTYTDTVTKDLIVKGSATADLTLSADEMASIYAKMKAIDIMDITIKAHEPSTTTCEQTPYGEDKWKITIDGATREFSWTDRYCGVSDEALKLKQLRMDIMKIVQAREEYKALPDSEGGYD